MVDSPTSGSFLAQNCCVPSVAFSMSLQHQPPTTWSSWATFWAMSVSFCGKIYRLLLWKPRRHWLLALSVAPVHKYPTFDDARAVTAFVWTPSIVGSSRGSPKAFDLRQKNHWAVQAKPGCLILLTFKVWRRRFALRPSRQSIDQYCLRRDSACTE